MSRLSLAAIALAVSAYPVNSVCSVEKDAADGVTSEFVLKGMKSHRQRLLRGEVLIAGMKESKYADGRTQEADVEMTVAFDFEKNLVRFDRREAADAADTQSADMLRSHYWRTKTEAAIAKVNNQGEKPTLEIHPTDYVPASPWHRPFDIRSVGVYYWPDFRKGTPLEEILEGFMSTTPVEATETPDGIYCLVWEFNDRQRRTLWIDGKRGFAPTKMIVQDKGTPIGEDWGINPVLANEASWKELDGVWVPDTFRIQKRTVRVERSAQGESRAAGENSMSYMLAFEWKSVNQPLPEELFSYREHELEDGSYVVDYRSGEPVVVELIGAEPTHRDGQEGAREHNTGWTLSRVLVIFGSVLILLAIPCFSFACPRKGTGAVNTACQRSARFGLPS